MSLTLGTVRSALRGRYSVKYQIAHGATARIYRAKERSSGRVVAIKVLAPRVTMRIARERFLSEITLASQLTHPHIVPVLDHAEVAGLLYLVMPFFPDGSVRDRLGRDTRLPVSIALAIGEQVADALAYAHQRDIIHRDIKPGNIMLADDSAMVLDFGLARAVKVATNERLTMAGEVIGTPAYMSPEQAMGKWMIDAKTDIYSLGCVLYEMLVGTSPFEGARSDAVMVRRLNDPVPRVLDARADAPGRA